MVEVIEVPGMTEEELISLAIEQSLDALEEPPPLGHGEFTLGVWQQRYIKRYGPISETGARRKLDALVQSGVLAHGRRRHPVTNRPVRAYWKRGEANDLSGDL